MTQKDARKIRWGRVFLLMIRMIVLIVLARALSDWLLSLMPDHPDFVRGAVGIAYVPFMVIFVMKPALEECGIGSGSATRVSRKRGN